MEDRLCLKRTPSLHEIAKLSRLEYAVAGLLPSLPWEKLQAIPRRAADHHGLHLVANFDLRLFFPHIVPEDNRELSYSGIRIPGENPSSELRTTPRVAMHRQSALPFWALLFAVPSVFSLPRGVERSTLLTKPSDVEKTYDYVIIGGGTSGLTVADRLTEDNRTKVLVIEYGELSACFFKVLPDSVGICKPADADPSRQATRPTSCEWQAALPGFRHRSSCTPSRPCRRSTCETGPPAS